MAGDANSGKHQYWRQEGTMPESITREEALERVLLMAQNAWSDDVKQECLRRAEELRR